MHFVTFNKLSSINPIPFLKPLERLHYVNTPTVLSESENELVLGSLQRKVFNPFFVTGCVLFAASMFLKANVDNRLAAIPLGVSALILLFGVWLLSANGKVIFSRAEQKVFRVYKHLGYVQKVHETPLQSVDKATRFESKNTGVYLQLDNLNTVLLCDAKALKDGESNALVDRINKFLTLRGRI
jgi:hypothetical protein